MRIQAFLLGWLISFIVASVVAFVAEQMLASFHPNYLTFLVGTGIGCAIVQTYIGRK